MFAILGSFLYAIVIIFILLILELLYFAKSKPRWFRVVRWVMLFLLLVVVWPLLKLFFSKEG